MGNLKTEQYAINACDILRANLFVIKEIIYEII